MAPIIMEAVGEIAKILDRYNRATIRSETGMLEIENVIKNLMTAIETHYVITATKDNKPNSASLTN